MIRACRRCPRFLTGWLCSEWREVVVVIGRDRDASSGGVKKARETLLKLGEVGHDGGALF